MDDVRHIGSGRAYLFQTTRNIVLEHARRSKIVRIDNVVDIDSLNIADDARSQERILAWDGAFERRIENVTAEQIRIALRHAIRLEALFTVKAGDFGMSATR